MNFLMRSVAAIVVLGCGILACGSDGSTEGRRAPEEGATRVAQADSVEQVDGPDDEYVTLPGGKRRHRSCVHAMPTGSSLNATTMEVTSAEGASLGTLPPCHYKPHDASNPQTPPAPGVGAPFYEVYDGADAAGTNGNPRAVCGNFGPPYYQPKYCANWINNIYGIVQVPPQPTVNDGQTMYIWGASLVTCPTPPTTQTCAIMQPVLTWGVNSVGYGGNFWSVSIYYIDQNGIVSAWYIGPTFGSITVGDWFRMETWVADTACGLDGNNCDWKIAGWFNNWSIPASTVQINAVPGVWTVGYRGVMENYLGTTTGVPCADLPGGATGSTSFQNVTATQPLTAANDLSHGVAENWVAGTNTPFSCAYNYSQISQYQVDISW